MPAVSLHGSLSTHETLSRWILAGLLTGVIDGLFSGVLSVAFYHSTVQRLFQGVASTLLGPEALNGGTKSFLIGLLMHFGVAFGWSAIFLLLYHRAASIRRILNTNSGVVKVASIYGPLVWMVMSLLVIPALVHRPPSLTIRWLVQFLGHFPFVGLPIVASIAGFRSEKRD